jgi:cytochrome P450 family 6
MSFGLLQTKIGLVFALSKYQFCICKETAVPLIFDPKSFILSPVGGNNLQIKNRTKGCVGNVSTVDEKIGSTR